MGRSENRTGAEIGILRRRRKTEGSPETQNTDIAPATVASKEQLPYSINPEAEVKGKRTLRLVLDENGNIDGSMRDKSVEDLRRAIENPAVKARLQPEEKKQDTKQKRPLITAKNCRTPWVFIGAGFSGLVSASFKVSKETRPIVGMICSYNPQELDQLSSLSADCLNFYADKLPTWIWDMIEQTTGPLAQLIEAVLSIHYVKYVTLKAALANPQEFIESVKANEAARPGPESVM